MFEQFNGANEASFLIRRLDEVIGAVPLTRADLKARHAEVRELVSALENLGMEGETLVRYAMPRTAALPLLITLNGSVLTEIPNLQRWRELLALPADGDYQPRVMAFAFAQLTSWVQQAPIDDVLQFLPPSDQAFQRINLKISEHPDIMQPYVWLHARSTESDLERWDTESLHAEYRWLTGLESRFPEHILVNVGPDEEVLKELIAFRAATGEGGQSEQEEMLWELQDAAVSFLAKDRRREAAALFEFFCRSYPESARGFNNLGFCLIPDDPGTALVHLERAARLGLSSSVINIYNQCCCLMMLNRDAEALDKAEYFWQRARDESDPDTGYIWVRNASSSMKLQNQHALEHALCILMVDVSEILNREDRRLVWESRKVESDPFTA